MCRAEIDGGRRCSKHGGGTGIPLSKWKQLSEEEQQEAIEKRITAEREKKAQLAEARAAKQAEKQEEKDARAYEQELIAAATRAEKLLTIPATTRVSVRATKDTIVAGGAAAVREAILAEPYVGEASTEEVIKTSRVEVEKADNEVAAERADIPFARLRAGRKPTNVYDRSAEEKVNVSLTAEQEDEGSVEAGVLGMTRSQLFTRKIANAKHAKKTDSRAALLTASEDSREGRNLWLQADAEKREEIVNDYISAERGLKRTQQLATTLGQADARMAQLKENLAEMNAWQRSEHPEGGFGSQRISLQELKEQKHVATVELAALRKNIVPIRAEHKALIAQAQQLQARKEQRKKDIILLLQATARIGTMIYKERYGNAFISSLKLGGTMHQRVKANKKVSAA